MEIDLESESVDVPIEVERAATLNSQGLLEVWKKRQKNTSNVWKLVTELSMGSDKIQRAKCNRCGSTYNSATR